MKVLSNLFGRAPQAKQEPLPEIHQVAPVHPQHKSSPERARPKGKRDEGLEIVEQNTDPDAPENPYETHSWKLNPENETRELKQIQVGKATDKGNPFNPYDTGQMRRGWKK